MKRQLALVGIGLAALSCAGLAVAKGIDGNKTATAVSGTFAATAVSGNTQTRTCTTSDNKTITLTHATFTGVATGSTTDLAGNLTVDTNSVINTTDNVGVVKAKLKIAATTGETDLHFTGVYGGGNVAGFVTGHAGTPNVKLLGNLSAGFSAAGGFTGAKIGGGTSGGSAVELGPGRCAPNKPVHTESNAVGPITAVSGTSITVAGLTCAVPANLAATVLGFHVNDQVHIRCTLVANVATLVKIDPKHHH